MRTQVFAYKGFIGIVMPDGADGLLNNPEEDFFVLVDATTLDITAEAVEALKNLPVGSQTEDWAVSLKEGKDELAGKMVFGWLYDGDGSTVLHPVLSPAKFDIDPATLPTTEVEVPAEFIKFVDANLNGLDDGENEEIEDNLSPEEDEK